MALCQPSLSLAAKFGSDFKGKCIEIVICIYLCNICINICEYINIYIAYMSTYKYKNKHMYNVSIGLNKVIEVESQKHELWHINATARLNTFEMKNLFSQIVNQKQKKCSIKYQVQ